MLCDDVKRFAYFFLDGSLANHKITDIEIHVSNCPDCEIRIIVHRKLRAFVRHRLSPVAAPERLRFRLSESIRHFAPAE
jgi:anti-sigma factor (TIGR02949 family)